MKDFQLDIYSYKGEQNSVSFAAENTAEFVQEAISRDYLSIGAQKPLDQTWVKASVFDHNVEFNEICHALPKSTSGKYTVIAKHGSKALAVVIVCAYNVVEALHMAAQADIPEKTDNIEAIALDEDVADLLTQELSKNGPVDVVLLGPAKVTLIDSSGEFPEKSDANITRIKYERLKVKDES